MKIDMKQMNRNKETCLHVYPDSGQYSFNVNGDGTVTCAICGETFRPIDDLTDEKVQNICDRFNSVLQMTKANLGSCMSKQDVNTIFELNRLAKELLRLHKKGQERLRKQLTDNNK